MNYVTEDRLRTYLWTLGAFSSLRSIGAIRDEWLEDETIDLTKGLGTHKWDQLDASGFRPSDGDIAGIVDAKRMGIKETHKEIVFNLLTLYKHRKLRSALQRTLERGSTIEDLLEMSGR